MTTVSFLYFSAATSILFSLIYLTLEVIQAAKRRKNYLTEFENYIQAFLYIFCVIFVFPVGHEGWCFPSWRWQIGAIVMFLAWLNCILLLKNMPYWGQNITMLFNVYFNFIKLIYLPILLVLTFGFPFYMLFVHDGTALKVGIINVYICYRSDVTIQCVYTDS